ncbi:MAG: SMI1/KNR4 family protein [Candidatus Limnocylindrales bacterium]
MARDWRPDIARLIQIKQAIAAADTNGVWEFHLPKVAATPDEIAAVELDLDVQLDAGYRNFLRYANGWPSFFQSVDLFGTADLAGGPRMGVTRRMLESLEPVVLEQGGHLGSQLIPIAATAVDLDMFVMKSVAGHQEPTVVWLAGNVIDQFECFEDYVLAMIEYNARELAAFMDA